MKITFGHRGAQLQTDTRTPAASADVNVVKVARRFLQQVGHAGEFAGDALNDALVKILRHGGGTNPGNHTGSIRIEVWIARSKQVRSDAQASRAAVRLRFQRGEMMIHGS